MTTPGLVGAFARRWMLFIKQPAGVAVRACVRMRVSFTFPCSGDQSPFTCKRSLHVRPAWVSEPLRVEDTDGVTSHVTLRLSELSLAAWNVPRVFSALFLVFCVCMTEERYSPTAQRTELCVSVCVCVSSDSTCLSSRSLVQPVDRHGARAQPCLIRRELQSSRIPVKSPKVRFYNR